MSFLNGFKNIPGKACVKKVHNNDALIGVGSGGLGSLGAGDGEFTWATKNTLRGSTLAVTQLQPAHSLSLWYL